MIDSFALFQWMNALQVINSNQLPILVDAIFIGSYFILINQLSQYAISPRRRRNIAEVSSTCPNPQITFRTF
ncbi:Hypothetical protein NTJ_08702 [Nesidiocoris tenuis]|uniref:Uncharacterized protein n=1 Tax=Nesidiocoris tenuis TaxID=355587 RepID=A0ABN7AUN0_9HEMI|nr:Hypothetical protein NTJ_08702 [Nesidiocoris tenuis]